MCARLWLSEAVLGEQPCVHTLGLGLLGKSSSGCLGWGWGGRGGWGQVLLVPNDAEVAEVNWGFGSVLKTHT